MALNVLVLIAVIWLFADRYGGGKHAEMPHSPTDTATHGMPAGPVVRMAPAADTSQVKVVIPDAAAIIAYINTDSVTEHYLYIQDVNKQLNLDRAKIEKGWEARTREFERKMIAAQNDPEILSDKAKYEETAARLQKEEQEILAYRESKAAALMKKESDAGKKMYDQIKTLIGSYCEVHGIDYVLGYSGSVPIVTYANPKYDITKIVLHQLNEAYKAQKNTQ